MNNEDLQKLKELALAASPGPWQGDRIDGTVKYHLLDATGKAVIRGDNGNSDSGPYGIDLEEDEKYLLAAHPVAILALIDRIESLAGTAIANAAVSELPPLPKAAVTTDTHIDGKGHPAFTADQMHAYGQACTKAAAATNPLAANAQLVEALQSALAIINNEADPDEYAAPLAKIRAALSAIKGEKA